MTDDDSWQNWPADGPEYRPSLAQVEASDSALERLDAARAALAARTRMWLNVSCTPTQASRYLRYMDGQTLAQIADTDGVSVRAVHKSIVGFSATATDRSSQPSPPQKIARILAADTVVQELLAQIHSIREELNGIQEEYTHRPHY